ncbi:MAG: sigma-70 family RNA polymerase sigma factor [Ignavibacteriae bacterium]|nr:sigma-70 family RNA polymerase sigma factor [Ignavibacteriota bacterium]
MSSFSNSTLVLELKSGDHAGCIRLVDRYQTRLLNEAVHVFQIPREDAEELVNDVLLNVVQNICSFEFRRSDSDFHVWVIAIFRNKVRDHFRRPALRTELFEHIESLADGDGEEKNLRCASLAASSAGEVDGEDKVEKKLMFIAEALERLKPWQRTLLRCRALDVPYRDIAHYTGLTVSQLKVYYPRVRKKFIQVFSELYPLCK